MSFWPFYRWPFALARRLQPEWMDQPDLETARHDRALRGLARLNRWSLSTRPLWPPIASFARHHRKTSLRVLDLACGAGDNPVRLWFQARRRGLDLRIEGWDRSPDAVAHARRLAAARGAPVAFERRDVLSGPIPPSTFDVLNCALFLHHLDETQAIELLRRMRQAGPGLILVSDLRRGRAGLALAWAASRLLTRSEVVHNDAPASVRNAYTLPEALALASRAGLVGATAVHHWPFRFLLKWSHS